MLDLVKPILKRCSTTCVNATDKAGDTALHVAARIGCKSIVKLLMKNEADPELKNEVSNVAKSNAVVELLWVA